MQTIRLFQFIALFLVTISMGCNGSSSKNMSELENKKSSDPTVSLSNSNTWNSKSTTTSFLIRSKALLATRFKSLDEFKSRIRIEYDNDSAYSGESSSENSRVLLTYISNGQKVISELKSGISQGDILKVQDADYWDQSSFILRSPYSIRNRIDLGKIYMLARRRHHIFGEGDVAFYDLAEASVKNITTYNLAYQNAKDSSEKGYINTFNHVTAQAFVTTFFSEELADFMADVHERHHMPELTTGRFTEEQLNDSLNYPLDNYVDMINNEVGQEIGIQLRKKYNISSETRWTPELLTNFLNDLQSYYIWALEIGLKPFRPTDELVIRFSNKINAVLDGV
ncbi:MAG: hypothetical protein COA58_06680 [Bacteroidetes bacterium]|nr:MAG: hypothetical protein COA58_06680 [Bacteroidota bacterium]